MGRNFWALAACVFVFLSSAEASFVGRSCSRVTNPIPIKKWNADLNFSKTEETLLTAKIIAVEKLEDYLRFLGKRVQGTTEAYAVFFENGLVAVFKPEKHLWSSYGELLVYRVSEYFDYHIVPPTVIRTIDGRTGSLQLFVETRRDLMGREKVFAELYALIPEIEKEQEKLIHFLSGQWDRHSANMLIDDMNHLISIDNGDAAATVQWRSGEHPWNLRGGQDPRMAADFPFDNYQMALSPSIKSFGLMFGDFMSEARIERFFKGVNGWRSEHEKWFNNGPVPYVIWQGGLWMQRKQDMNLITLSPPDLKTRNKLMDLQDRDLPHLMRGIELPGKEDEMRVRIRHILSIH